MKWTLLIDFNGWAFLLRYAQTKCVAEQNANAVIVAIDTNIFKAWSEITLDNCKYTDLISRQWIWKIKIFQI